MVKQVIYSTCRFSLLGSLSDNFELQFFRDSFHVYTTVGIACRANYIRYLKLEDSSFNYSTLNEIEKKHKNYFDLQFFSSGLHFHTIADIS